MISFTLAHEQFPVPELARLGPLAEEDAEAQIPLRQVYAPWVVSTDPNAHIQKIKQLFASGVWIANIHSGQEQQRAVIGLYGKEVLPDFK